MAFSNKTRQSTQMLLSLVVNNMGKPIDYSHFPRMTNRKVPDDILIDRSQGDFLIITDEKYDQYYKCLDSLSGEPTLECMSRDEIDTELWHLVCDAYANYDKLNNATAIKQKAALFESSLLSISKPIKQYEVLIPIRGLQLKSNAFLMGDVKFVQMGDQMAKEWDLKKGENVWQDQLYDAIFGQSVAIIPERGNDPGRATKRARAKLLIVLNLLRTALLVDHDPRIISFRIHDVQMLFELGEFTALRVIDESKVLASWTLGFRSMDLILEGEIETQVAKSSELLNDLAKAIGETGKGVQVRFIRAMEWIGSSVVRENIDDKIVDLCTALEAFLATKANPMKGEIIVLRMMLLSELLGRPFWAPSKVLGLYEKRSDIVHGSDKGVCTDTEYIVLRTITVQVLQDALTYVKANNITKYSDFLKSLHKDSSLVDKTVKWWEHHPKYDDICKAVESYNKAAESS
jgi:hypothetical protein